MPGDRHCAILYFRIFVSLYYLRYSPARKTNGAILLGKEQNSLLVKNSENISERIIRMLAFIYKTTISYFIASIIRQLSCYFNIGEVTYNGYDLVMEIVLSLAIFTVISLVGVTRGTMDKMKDKYLIVKKKKFFKLKTKEYERYMVLVKSLESQYEKMDDILKEAGAEYDDAIPKNVLMEIITANEEVIEFIKERCKIDITALMDEDMKELGFVKREVIVEGQLPHTPHD